MSQIVTLDNQIDMEKCDRYTIVIGSLAQNLL